jgi:cholinesterase
MTLFGESAGGASVDFYSYAWTKDPIINAFIPQSGTASMISPFTKSVNDSGWYGLTHRLGCGKAKSGAKTVDCMRSLPAATVMSQFALTGPIPDEKVVFSDYAKRSAEGNFIKRVSFPVNAILVLNKYMRLIAAVAHVGRQFRRRSVSIPWIDQIYAEKLWQLSRRQYSNGYKWDHWATR